MTEDLKKVHSYLPRLVDQLEQKRVDRREFLRTATLLGLSAGSAYALAGLPEPGAGLTRSARAAGGTVRIAIRVPALDNPHTYSWIYDANQLRQAIDYLTRTGIDNVTRPRLLEKWEASDDLKTWTLTLKKGIKWSNGDELVADHAIWNITRWLDPKVGSSVVGLMKGYMLKDVDTGTKDDKGNPVMTVELWDANAIEKVDDYTVRLNCQEPQLAVPEHLFHYPASILHPNDNGVFGIGAIGTGAFTMVEYEVGKKSVFKRRDGYWGVQPALDSVEFIDLGDDPAAALSALSSGQVHGLYEASTTQYAALQKLDHVAIHTVNTAQTGVARMQPGHKPWDDPRVRKAMRLGLDTEKLVQIAHLGLGQPGEHHHVARVHPEYADVGYWKQDIEAAKKLLADAGYPDGIETEIVCKKDPDWELISVQAMAQMWEQIGAKVRVNVLPSAQYWDIWNAPTNPFAFTAWTHRPLGVMVLALAYRTGVPWNESHWSNAKFDSLLATAEGTLDVDARRKVMAEIQTLMLEEGPIAIPLWRAVFTAMSKQVKGYEMHPTNYFFCEEWSLDA